MRSVTLKSVNLSDVSVGDTLTRMLGGTFPMLLRVTRTDDMHVYCATPDGRDEWVFERAGGLEYDPELGWGSRFGITGSFISEVSKGL
ncbi:MULTISPECIES: hypothetical protein [Ramlibacter]|uniref:Uncharacterized protein n=1 Tax=Ramlibacter pinisoli TaxID=2682844 RepID=A0A6N8IPT6_9BURK|nr:MULTISPECIES: hypothetical protein [Ramlibacter]MBA2960511.1 hypothetical protein [Ramlibacter sp. CGMCC 1.13660]MVQ27843.1 hypothetical protein [Ramlibacter pinisoli]